MASLLIAAGFIHAFSALPVKYSWDRTLQLFWRALTDEYFVVCALYCTVAGIVSNPLSRNRFRSMRRATWLAPDIASVTCAAWAVVVWFPYQHSYNGMDLACFPILLSLILHSAQGRSISAIATGTASATIVFVIVSYAFTIIKSQIFVVERPHDDLIVAAEVATFGRRLYPMIANWSSVNPWIVTLSDQVYFMFFHHIALVAIFIFGRNDASDQRRYISSLSLCYLLGAATYYILPAKGPAFYDPETFSYLRQHARFTLGIQNLLRSSTDAAIRGDLELVQTYAFIAAMPSLHMAHETIMLFFSRRSPLMLLFSGLFWVASLGAVLVLGWHYLFDVLGGILLAVLVLSLVYWLPQWR